MGRGTLLEVQDGLGDTPGGAGQVGSSSKRFGMGCGTLTEVQDESEDPSGC